MDRCAIQSTMNLDPQDDEDPRWAQVVARDRSADGQFIYAVSTTGIYCRPSCPSRQANRGNVSFHDGPEAARAAGYRACRRCRPDEPGEAQTARRIARACRLIETAEAPPSLAALAAAAGLSPYHFHRLFKAATGLTPKGYARAQQARRMQEGLSAGATVTAAIYDAGYGSSSRFYEASDAVLGMPASTYRAGGADQQIRFATGPCSLGWVLAASTRQGVCAIFLGDEPDVLVADLRRRFLRADLIEGDTDFGLTLDAVVRLVEAPGLGLDLPLDIRGTAFQQRVWDALRAIPPGQTASYRDVAHQIGAPKAVRAVAAACAANLLGVAIPCHRVVRSDGALSGYYWGLARKRALLDKEQVMSRASRT